MVITIEQADYQGDHKIKLLFSDGTQRIVDFGPFLCRALNPMTTTYRDIREFQKFELLHGDLVWNDYEMCFPIWDLYEGNI